MQLRPIAIVAFLIAAGAIVLVPVAVRGTPAAAPPYCPLGICDPDAAKLPPDKRAIWDAEKRRHDDALAQAAPTADNPGNILRPPGTPQAWATGIIEQAYSPYSRLQYTFLNHWQDNIGGQHVRVFAGELTQDPTQGVILVDYTTFDGKIISREEFLTPIKSGYARVAKADGTMLTIVTRGGDSWAFDAAAGVGLVVEPPLMISSLQLDMDPATPGVQPSIAISGAQDINIDIVLGDNVGNVSAFNFTLIYDDTLLTPAGAKDGALDGNPDFNQAALGTAWNCSSAGSPSPDVDPATGAGRGAALLSCYAQSGGTALTAATVIGTLHLHAAAAVAASIALADVSFTHDDGAELGSCNPIITVDMTCAGGSLVTP